jgi:hypothetical protein
VTRKNQKVAERAALDALLSALGTVPTKVEPGETPDFMLSLGESSIGVEMTTFQSNAPMDGKLGRRQVESEWERLKSAIEKFRGTRVELRDLNVGLMFKGAGPPRADHQAFMEEVAVFALAQAAELTDQDIDFWPPAFTSPLMIKFLQTVYLRRCQYACWYSSIAAGWVGLPDSTLTQIIREKAGRPFRLADETWLAVQSTTRISELLVPLNGAADFEEIPGLTSALKASPFARVFVFGPGGLFQWSQATGWTS